MSDATKRGGGYHTPRTPAELLKARDVRRERRAGDLDHAMKRLTDPRRIAAMARASTSIATGNRWGGPHKHAREIARTKGGK